MRDWSLSCSTNATGPGEPLVLTLAADMRLCKPDYINDHIWELEIGAGEPAGLTVRTTYGLRARNMRLFYRFGEAGRTVMNPAEFARGPRLRRFYPNLLCLDIAPFEGLEALVDYWVPESHVLAGRIVLTNRTQAARKVDLDLCGALTPLDGKPLALLQQQMVNVLAGSTGGLAPVLFMTGGPNLGPGPHPSLMLKLDLEPGASRTVTWCFAAEKRPEASFELARRTAARSWDAERTRIELLDAGDTLDIRTGNPDWDAALAFSQRAALGSFHAAGEHLPRPSFVVSRQPDTGYSHSGTGTDHPAGWSGQTPLETYYASTLLPAAPALRRGLIENFLSVQAEDGSIDGKPGMAGQRARFMAAPLLAGLGWQSYEDTGDEAFLQASFDGLLRFFDRWFSPEQDPDLDGIPGWDHVLQSGFEDHPLFDTWHPWSQGLPVGAVFNPALESLLYREADALIRMAEKLGRTEEIGRLHARAAVLRASVEAGWNAEAALYGYRDRVTDRPSTGKAVAQRTGAGEMRPRKAHFVQPVRLVIDIRTEQPGTRRPTVEISGAGSEAEAVQRETIESDQFQWRAGGLTAVTTLAYSKIGFVSASGLQADDTLAVHALDTTPRDITLFAPLWARIPDARRADAMIKRALLGEDGFMGAYGVRALHDVPEPQAEPTALSVHMPWNELIGEALLAYGYRAEAARLTEALMEAAICGLKQSRSFYERYHAASGSGIGQRGALTGLAPVGLFLQVLGVRVLSPTRVKLEGKNPFPWPVTISYKGLTIARGPEETQVTFPNGRTVKVEEPEPCLVSL